MPSATAEIPRPPAAARPTLTATVHIEDAEPPAAAAAIDEAPAPIPNLPPAPTVESCDMLALQHELHFLKDAIEQMKREIATLRAEKPPAPSLQKATCELDAVVQATEDATHNILEAAEAIDEALMQMRGGSKAAIDPATIDRLSDQVIRIFESCNFQDITGQRITKVVNAMKFIEVKIDRMIEILGGSEALQDVELPTEEEVVDEDAKLLEGPQLDGESKISQNDIDRFFD